jgi:hypothetical protein
MREIFSLLRTGAGAAAPFRRTIWEAPTLLPADPAPRDKAAAGYSTVTDFAKLRG